MHTISIEHTHAHSHIYIIQIYNNKKHSQLTNTHILLLELEIHRKIDREER